MVWPKEYQLMVLATTIALISSSIVNQYLLPNFHKKIKENNLLGKFIELIIIILASLFIVILISIIVIFIIQTSIFNSIFNL